MKLGSRQREFLRQGLNHPEGHVETFDWSISESLLKKGLVEIREVVVTKKVLVITDAGREAVTR